MTRISRKMMGWLLGAVAFVTFALGIAFTHPQTKAVSAATASVTWEDSTLNVEKLDGYQRLRVNTSGLHWTSYNNQSFADEYLAYTKLNGRTVKEINAAAKAAGETSQIYACLQPAGSFSFYSVYIPNDFKELLVEDVYSFAVEPGWTHVDSSTNPTYPGTGNTYTLTESMRYNKREGTTWRMNTAGYTDIVSGSTFGVTNQGTTNGTTCYLLYTTNSLWGNAGTLKLNDPILNNLYINGKSIDDWNEEAQAAVAAGTATDMLYGSTHGQNAAAGAPIAVLPGHADGVGSFLQIYVAENFLPTSDVYTMEWRENFEYMVPGTRATYYMPKTVRLDSLGGQWRQITEFVNLDGGNMRVIDQGTSSTGVNCFLVAFGSQEKIANYMGFNDNYKKVSPLTGITYGENLDYITINGKTIGQIKAENPSYNYSTSTHELIKNGGLYAPIFAQISSANLGDGTENFIQIYIPNDLINPSTVTEIGLSARLFTLNGTVKYGLTKDVTFVKTNGSWGLKPIEIETEITSVHASIQNFLTFGLSNHDYSSLAANTGVDKTRLTASGLWEHIEVNGVTLTATTTNESVYNIYGRATNTYSVRLTGYASDNAEGDVTKVTIKAGARFPSYAYNSTGVGAPIYYVVKEDVTFVYDSTNGWHVQTVAPQYTVTFLDGDGNVFATQKVTEGEKATAPTNTPTKESTFDYKYTFSGWYAGETAFDFENTAISENITLIPKFVQEDNTIEIETSILSVEWGVNNNNFLAFELGTHDYTGVSVPKLISGGHEKIKATNMFDRMYFDGICARDLLNNIDTNLHLNIFTMGKFGFRVGTAGEEFPYQKITVKAGCQFLSNAYIQGTSKTVYVTMEDLVLVNWYGSFLEEDSIPATQVVDVVRLTYAESENWLVFTFDDVDYPMVSDDTNELEVSSTYLNQLRFFDYIEVSGSIRLNHYENGTITGVDVVEKATLAKIYSHNGKPASGLINIWKQQNTFAIRIVGDKNKVNSTITSVTIKEGAEFPSYQAAIGNAAAKVSYMVLNQVEFEKTEENKVFTCTTASSKGIDMWMSQGASVRIAGANSYDSSNSDYFNQEGYKLSGIRFQTNISKAALAELENKLADGSYQSVSFGTLIVPAQYLMGGQFTHDWLNKNGKDFLDIKSSAGIGTGWAKETDEYVSYFGSIVQLKTKNHARNFAGLGYVLVEKSDGTEEYFYAPYETSYARSAAYIAQMAISDRMDSQTEEYNYKVNENNNWSPYTNNERKFLALYLSTLAESQIEVKNLSSELVNVGSTFTLDMRQNGLAQQIGSYIHLTYSTNINVLGTLVYSSTPNATTTVAEEFYLQAGSGEHKQYLDLFRKNGLGYYKGTQGSYSSTRLINPNSVYLKEIIFKNAELKAGATPQVQLVGFRSTYKTLDTQDLPGNSVHLYLTREQTEDKATNEYQEVTIGANLALGGSFTYLAKSGVYEGLTSSAVKRAGDYAIKNYGQYIDGTVGMSTDKSVFKYTDPISGLYYIGGSGVGGSKPGVGVNLINNHDPGRQIQQSYYAAVGGSDEATSGANGYTRAYCYTESSAGKYWPYNPVQAGDCGNNTSQIIDYELNTDKNYIYVKTRAMDWAQGIDHRLGSQLNQKNAIEGGRTTKSYMENYYYLNADGTVKVDNSFVDWNGFTNMESCAFQSNELPATILSHTLAYYVSNTSTKASDAWSGDLTYVYRPDSYLQTDADGAAFDGRKYENWYAWSADNKGSFALGMYIPNVCNFSSNVINTSNSLSEERNANANNKGHSKVCPIWTGNGTEMLYNYAGIRAGWESCYVFNDSYTAPSTAYRMEEYKTMQYSYVISVNSVATIRSQFKTIYDSGALTNGGKVGEKIGLDTWARMDKPWTW